LLDGIYARCLDPTRPSRQKAELQSAGFVDNGKRLVETRHSMLGGTFGTWWEQVLVVRIITVEKMAYSQATVLDFDRKSHE